MTNCMNLSTSAGSAHFIRTSMHLTQTSSYLNSTSICTSIRPLHTYTALQFWRLLVHFQLIWALLLHPLCSRCWRSARAFSAPQGDLGTSTKPPSVWGVDEVLGLLVHFKAIKKLWCWWGCTVSAALKMCFLWISVGARKSALWPLMRPNSSVKEVQNTCRLLRSNRRSKEAHFKVKALYSDCEEIFLKGRVTP